MKQIAKKMWALDFGSLGVGEFICPSCGQPITLQNATCPNCGYDLVAYRQANGIKQPPLSSAAVPPAASANFGTIDFGSATLSAAKPARQLLPEEVTEFDQTSAAAGTVRSDDEIVPAAAATESTASTTDNDEAYSQASQPASAEPTSAAAANTASLVALVAQVQSNQAVVNEMLAQLQSDQAALRQLADSVATSAASAAASAAVAPRPRRRSWLTRLLQRVFAPRQRQLPPPK
ncbi:zinc ribbon domain-containing protein [Loigolactobacillus binensis]|uniref:Zinc ribbon domain-containing protein n=1 Tax=Loigolactobacillus binensis TaxID=2559922 RepID=A0ABW3EFB6_9LACO|nr:zinc ribbon domain-containing protein [Loigolactobacillus binensis]